MNFGICNPANTPDTSINLDPNEYMDDPNVQPEQEVMRETESSNSTGKRYTNKNYTGRPCYLVLHHCMDCCCLRGHLK